MAEEKKFVTESGILVKSVYTPKDLPGGIMKNS